MSHAAIVCREYGLPAVVGTGRATPQIRTGQTIRVDGSTGVVTLARGVSAQPLACRSPSSPRRTTDASAARARTSASCCTPGFPCRPASRSRRRPSTCSSTSPACAARSPAALARPAIGELDPTAPPRRRSARRCAGAASRRRPRRDRAPLRRARRQTESPRLRSRCARRQLGEDSAEATFAGQQETYLWVCGVDGICAAVRDCWASLYSSPAISYRAHLGAGRTARDGRRRAAHGRRRGRRGAVHLQPRQRRSEHGRRQRELGARRRCRRRRGDSRTTTSSARSPGEVVRERRGLEGHPIRAGPGGGGTVREDVPPELREAPCLDERDLASLVEVARARRAPLRLATRTSSGRSRATRARPRGSRPAGSAGDGASKARASARRSRRWGS